MLFKLAILATGLLCISVVNSEVSNDSKNFVTGSLSQGAPIIPPVGIEHTSQLQGKNHSLILGRRTYGDRLLYVDTAKMPSKFWRIVETTINFPAYGTKNNKTINYLQIIDRVANGTNGWPYILKGGIGSKNVTMHFRSQRGYGLDFIAYIYGF